MPPKPPASRFLSGLMGFTSSAMVSPSVTVPAVSRPAPLHCSSRGAGAADLSPTFGWAGPEPGAGREEGLDGLPAPASASGAASGHSSSSMGVACGRGAGSYAFWAVFWSGGWWGGLQFSSVQFSRSVVSDSLRPHESQHARSPCPSPTPGVHSDSCSSSR